MTYRPLIVRSKNAGPFTLTIDILFEDAADAVRLHDDLVTGRLVTERGPLSGAAADFHLDAAAAAVKITTARTVPAGSFGDLDLYGCQQHAGVLRALGLELGDT